MAARGLLLPPPRQEEAIPQDRPMKTIRRTPPPAVGSSNQPEVLGEASCHPPAAVVSATKVGDTFSPIPTANLATSGDSRWLS
jgi:hypothetical protein